MRTTLIFFFFAFILTGCIQDKSTKKNNFNSENTISQCNGANYNSIGCPGYVATTGSTTGSTSSSCLGNNYYLVAGCPGYCISYPSAAQCQSGSTTGDDWRKHINSTTLSKLGCSIPRWSTKWKLFICLYSFGHNECL